MAFVPATYQDFLDLAARLLPASYLDPLRNKLGPGYEILQAMARICARASAAVGVLDQEGFYGTATAGSYATAQVKFSRPSAAAGALTIKAGTVVSCSATGRDWILTQDVAVGALATLTAATSVRAIIQSAEWGNAKAPTTAANGDAIPGDIDTITTLVMDPAYADPTFTVVQFADAVGGAADDLDQLGADEGIGRQAGETDAHYRPRLRQLPDVVSPAAIKRAVQALFAQFSAIGAQWSTTYFYESWQLQLQTAWDVPNLAGLPSSSPLHAADLNSCFFYDDTRGPGGTNIPNPSGYYGRWMDEGDRRGAFFIIVPNLAAINDQGLFYDDPQAAVSGAPFAAATTYATALGRRGTSAYDAAGLIGPATQGFYDGIDLQKAAVYAGLFALLDGIKAGGVTTEVLLFGLS